MYDLVTYEEARAQVAALPVEALTAYAHVLDVLQLTPWNVLEDQQRVDVIDVVWPG